MKARIIAIAAVALMALLVVSTINNVYSISIDISKSSSTSSTSIDEHTISSKLSYSKISLPFIANIGQYNNSIRYYTDTFIGRVLIYDDEIVYLLKDKIVKERLITNNIILKANDKSITTVNYFIGDKVLTDIPTYNSISFISNDIELVLKAYNNNIEKVFIIKPYTNPNIVMELISNDDNITIDNERLVINDIAFTKPIAYQMIDNDIVYVDVSYKIISDNRYGFDIGKYDNRYELIIDPLLDLKASTYIGGSRSDRAYAISLDSNNNIFIAGDSRSTNFPIVNGYDNTHNGSIDAFVAKFNNDLDTLLASTYIGGGNDDFARAISLDSNNNIFIAGYTRSNNFPIVNGSDNTHNGSIDAFIAKLSE